MALEVSTDELVATFLPILVYWVYSGMYVMLESFENYKLHSKKAEEEKNLVSRFTVVKGVLFQQSIQAIVTILLFKVYIYISNEQFIYRVTNFYFYFF